LAGGRRRTHMGGQRMGKTTVWFKMRKIESSKSLEKGVESSFQGRRLSADRQTKGILESLREKRNGGRGDSHVEQP